VLLIVAVLGLQGFERWALIPAAATLFAIGITTQALIAGNERQMAAADALNASLRAEADDQRQAAESLSQGLNIGVFICDSRAHVIYANARAQEIFRMGNPTARSILALTLSHDLENLVLAALKTGEVQTAELAITAPEDRIITAKAWVAPSSGQAYLSIDDITDLRRLERVRQDFVANVSHELRTPLTIIRAMAETLLDQTEPESDLSVRYLTKIVAEVDQLSMITQDLLVLSAAESNPIRKQDCNLAEVFRNVVLQLTSKAKAKSLELIFEGPEKLEVQANASQMAQVAVNLVDNAINYTSSGWVHVKVCSEGESAIVTIEDSGIGIASDHLGRIFERFYRVDKARSRNTGGTGLGLSIVKHLIEAHGGTVGVESSLNEGTKFTIRIPVGNPAHQP
jgi:two-component system phosphate regulon sensor histidine kinase PhoR